MRTVLGLAVLLMGLEEILGQQPAGIIGVCVINESDNKYLQESMSMITQTMLENPTQQNLPGCMRNIDIDKWTVKKSCAPNTPTYSFSYNVNYSYTCLRGSGYDCQNLPNIVSTKCFAGTAINSDGSVYYFPGEEPRCVA